MDDELHIYLCLLSYSRGKEGLSVDAVLSSPGPLIMHQKGFNL
jgi:hypothetical protein